MSDAPSISVDDLPADVRKKLGLTLPRRRGLSKNDVRTHAIRVLAAVASLTPNERRRVLQHALKLNDV